MKRQDNPLGAPRLATMLAVIGASSLGVHAGATEIATGNPDLVIRWDNTVRATVGVRAEKRDSLIANNSSYDESDFKFDRGDLVSKRIDLLSEFDLVYKRKMGFRVSAAGWYDHAYRDTSVRKNPLLPATDAGLGTSYVGAQYSDYTKRYYRGPSGEILDAFVFGQFDLGRPAAVKLGRHTTVWGESLFTSTQGVSYSQSPIDGLKAATNPGIEAKELFLPLTQLSGSVQLTDELALQGQYYLEWKPSRLPEGGTYLGGGDTVNFGPNVNRAPYLGPDDSVGRSHGNFGLSARWSPDWLDGTLGVFYRKFDDTNAWQMIAALPATTRPVYATDVKLYGISLSKNISGASVGMDLTYRRNAPLNSTATGNPALGPSISPNGEGARGNTWHLVLNAQYALAQSKFYDSASLAAELVYSRLDKVTSNPGFFKSVGYTTAANCPGGGTSAVNDEILAGCATNDYYSIQLSAAPTYNQVFTGWSLAVPITLGYGIKGNPATLSGGNAEGSGNYRVGLSFSSGEQQLDIAWTDYILKARQGAGAVGTAGYSAINGAAYGDRGWLSVTYKTAF